LDGEDDHAIAATTIWPNSSTFATYTVEAWIHPTRLGASILTDDAYAAILFTPTGKLAHTMYYRTPSSLVEDELSQLVGSPLHRWIHLALMFDAPNRRFAFVINGDFGQWFPIDSAAVRLYEDARTPFMVGAFINASGAPEGTFQGWIDEVRISSVVRYTADFTPEARFADDDHTKALYHFDELPGATEFQDSSGNNFHLQGRNGAASAVSDRPGDVVVGPLPDLAIHAAVELEFQTMAGASYQLESSTDLKNWTPLDAPITGDGSVFRKFVSARGIEARYFRLHP